MSIDGLTLDQLRLFVTVAETGTFSATSRRLHRAQSAVSYGIANLEALLGVKLFDRTGRTTRLTAPGRALLDDAREVLLRMSSLESHAAVLSEGLESEVAMVLDAIVPARILIEVAVGFRQAFPSVALQLHTEVLEGVAARILDGTCVVGLAGPVGSDAPSLKKRRLADIRIVAVASAEHPLARLPGPVETRSVRAHPQVVISTSSPTSDQGVLASVRWRVADAHTKLALIDAGLGWGNLPLEMVQARLDGGQLVRLDVEEWGPGPLHVPIFSLVREDRALGPAAKWLVDELPNLAEANRSNARFLPPTCGGGGRL